MNDEPGKLTGATRPPRWTASDASIIVLRPRHMRPRDFTHSAWSPVAIRHDDRRPGIRGQGTAAAEIPATAATRFVDPDRTSPTANNPGWLVSNGSGKRPAPPGPLRSSRRWLDQ